MGIKLYIVQPAENVGVAQALPLEGVRWNVAGTEFIAEFMEVPEGVPGVLSHEEALDLMATAEWTLPEGI